MGVSQVIFVVLCGFSAIGLYWLLVASIRQGLWQIAVVTAFFTSPTMLLVWAGTFEQRSPLGLLDFDRQSWAVLIGDTVALPTAAATAALAWGSPRFHEMLTKWQLSTGRIVLFFVGGLVAGILFHYWDITANYVPAGAGMTADSPTKWWHDLVAYPVLFGALLYASIPIVFRRRASWNRWVIVACGLVWLGLVMRDTFLGRLDPNWLHPAWDVVRFQPLR